MRGSLAVFAVLAACGDDPAQACEAPGHEFVDGPPPSGTWSLSWRCDEGCDQPPPALASADLVQFGSDDVLWRRQAAVLAQGESTREGACIHAALSAGDCTGGTWLCLRGNGLVIDSITWADGGLVQRWTVAAAR